MNTAQLYYDVEKRLRTDTGANGLFPTGGTPLVTGIFNNFANERQNMPYIVFTLISGVDDGTFDTNEDDIQFQLSVFASKRPPQLQNLQKILSRIYGDGVKRSDRLPTYGLHRHTLVSSWPYEIETTDTWAYTPCYAGGEFHFEEEDHFHSGRVWKCRMYQTFASTQ